MAYAAEQKPDAIVDFATLTGAVAGPFIAQAAHLTGVAAAASLILSLPDLHRSTATVLVVRALPAR